MVKLIGPGASLIIASRYSSVGSCNNSGHWLSVLTQIKKIVFYLAQRCKHVMKILIVYESIPVFEKGHIWWNFSQQIFFDILIKPVVVNHVECLFELLYSICYFHKWSNALAKSLEGDGAFWDNLIKLKPGSGPGWTWQTHCWWLSKREYSFNRKGAEASTNTNSLRNIRMNHLSSKESFEGLYRWHFSS